MIEKGRDTHECVYLFRADNDMPSDTLQQIIMAR